MKPQIDQVNSNPVPRHDPQKLACKLPRANSRFVGKVSLLLFLCWPQLATSKPPKEIFDQVSGGIVVIEALDKRGARYAFGSGVVVEKGVVVTNCHVVENATALRIKRNQTAWIGRVEFRDWQRDLCLLRANRMPLPPVSVASLSTVTPGSHVVAIGSPRGLELSVSDGIVSAVRDVDGRTLIQVTAPISPGSSGGGLFNDNGDLVGITTFVLTNSQNLNFAVPAEFIRDIPMRAGQLRALAKERQNLKFEATSLRRERKCEELLTHTKNWTERHPDDANSWFHLSKAYGCLKRDQERKEALRIAIRVDPGNSDANADIAGDYMNERDFDLAIHHYKLASESIPNTSTAAIYWNTICNMSALRGDRAGIMEAYQTLLRNKSLSDSSNTLGDMAARCLRLAGR